MADITMCSGVGCPFKESCYRFTAKADELMQSYFTKPPLEKKECKYFIDNKKKK